MKNENLLELFEVEELEQRLEFMDCYWGKAAAEHFDSNAFYGCEW